MFICQESECSCNVCVTDRAIDFTFVSTKFLELFQQHEFFFFFIFLLVPKYINYFKGKFVKSMKQIFLGFVNDIWINFSVVKFNSDLKKNELCNIYEPFILSNNKMIHHLYTSLKCHLFLGGQRYWHHVKNSVFCPWAEVDL